MSAAIETHQLSKRFGEILAVDSLTLEIKQGEIFGLLGPNGAGKSTTIRVLAGIMSFSAGSARVLGLDLATCTELIKQRIGYVAQNFGLYPELTVMENLCFYSAVYGVSSKERLTKILIDYGLQEYATRRADALSGGFKRRLAIACALAHDPELVFLDEPTAGIDPLTRKDIWRLFYEMRNQGKTLFVTTHYMEEAERCERLGFLNRGRLAAYGTPKSIKNQLDDLAIYSAQLRYDPSLMTRLEANDQIEGVNQFGNELRIVANRSMTPPKLLELLRSSNPDVTVNETTAQIEDAFMILTREPSPQ